MRQAGLYAISHKKFKPKQEKREVTETKNLLLEPGNKELIYQTHFKTRDEATLAIFEYIEVFYNRERLHSSLLYQTPHGFELNQNIHHEEVLLHAVA